MITGDAADPGVVGDVLGHDGVIAINAASSRDGPYQAGQVARVLTAAMTEHHVTRLVVTSAYPIVATHPESSPPAAWTGLEDRATQPPDQPARS